MLENYTKTPVRRQNFFSYLTKKHGQHLAVYWLLVQQFKSARKKTQAQFIKDWFLDGNIPADLREWGFLRPLNAGDSLGSEVGKRVAAGDFTGGGVFGGLMGKPKLPANLFDETLEQIREALQDPGYGLRTFQPDVPSKQRSIKDQVLSLKWHLTRAGFDCLMAGIY
jgi:hypothetical protein